MKRVAIYSRKSKDTDKGESINNQIQMCKEYFLSKSNDYEFEIFQDEGFTGGNTNRPQFQRMMLQAKYRKFDIIACYKIDRMARNIVDFMNTYDTLEKNNVKLVSITEGFDPDTPGGMMMMTMMAGFAEMERRSIAQRVKDNMLELAKLGRWSGGTPPTGYNSVEVIEGTKTVNYLELDDSYRSIINTIFNKSAEGYTTFNIAKILDMPSKTIMNIIRNPVYCKSDEISKDYLIKLGYAIYGEINGKGYLPYNRRAKAKDGKKTFNNPEMFVAVSKHEGFVDSDLWIKANINLDSRGLEPRPRISQKTFLAHLVKCKCGSGMFVYTDNKKYKDGRTKMFFRCSAKKFDNSCCDSKLINIYNLESDVLELLKEFSSNEKALEKYISSTSLSTAELDYEINQITDKINKLNSDINNLTEKLILLNDNAAKIIATRINNTSNEIEKLNTHLFNLEIRKIELTKNNNDISSLNKSINKLFDNWSSLSMEDKQVAIRLVIKQIQYLGGKDFKIIFIV